MSTNIFELASRQKLRIDTVLGQLSVEDLWTLPLRQRADTLTNLDSLTKDVYLKLQATDGTTQSFVDDTAPETNKETAKLELTFEILKRIIEVRKAEEEHRLNEKQRKETEQTLLRIKHARETNKLENLTDEELDAMIASCK